MKAPINAAESVEVDEAGSEINRTDTAGRAVSLLGVLILAKVLTLAGRDIPLSPWTLPAYLWQDLLFALMFAALDAAARRPQFGWMLYTAAVAYVAFNVPLIRAVSSPFTWPMIRAARGALSDSITHYVTATNLLLIGAVVFAAVTLPGLSRRWSRLRLPRLQLRWAAVVTVPLLCLGSWAVTQIDTFGLHRNYTFAFLTSVVPRIDSQPGSEDWFLSPFPQDSLPSSSDLLVSDLPLSDLHGTARGHNVVLIILESAGAQYLKPYGAAEDPMPHLTELTQNAILFKQAYTVYPESIKGLVSVLSSISPALDTEAEQYRNIGNRSLASELRDAGYRTGLFHSGRFMYLGMESVIRDRGFDTLEDAGDISGVHFSSFGVDEPSTVERMLAWIDEEPTDEPFFLTYMPVAGHHPYDSPEPGPFPEFDDIGRYRNALHYADSAIAQLTAGLAQRGLDEKTMIVIVGDHGQAFGQHEGNFGHTFFLYEENVRVPLMFVVPSLTKPVQVGRVVSTLDVAPTVLDLLGRESPNAYQGRSLLSTEQRMALFFTDYSQALLGLRDGRWKFLHEVESGRLRLFDLEADPGERNNLANHHANRVQIYRDRLTRWSSASRAFVLGDR